MKFTAAFLTFLLILSYNLFGQNEMIQTVSVAGGNGGINNVSLDWTVGQIAITTLVSDQNILTQGLFQENLLVTRIEPYLQNPEIKVYPNPATRDLIISISDSKTLNYILTDLNGKLMLKGQCLNTENRIDLKDLPSGEYILQFPDTTFRSTNSFKITKL